MAGIFITGHRGMVGSALVRALKSQDVSHELIVVGREELDLLDQSSVDQFLKENKPDIVINAAACQQPIREEYLLTGPLEKTNEAYALAKIAGLEMCRHYRKQYGVLFHSAMPTNLYGPGDNYVGENSHVLPALIRRFHEAKEAGAPEVVIWGTGTPRRELMHVDDLAAGVLFLLEMSQPPDWVNLGTGVDHSIQEIAELVKKTVGYEGTISNDTSKPDGMPVKRLDVSRINELGWKAKISFEDGVVSAYQDFLGGLKSGTTRL
jgi:GDP-L-fucose synthase